MTWTPVVALGATLLLVAGLFRVRDASSSTVLAMGAAAVAAAFVAALRDPAAAMLAPLPVARLTRRLLRLVETAAFAVPIWLVVALVLPGDGTGLAPLLALTSAGVAAATWLPVDRDVMPAVVVPLLWATVSELFGDVAGVGGALDLWSEHPWPVFAAGASLIVLGRHR
jgi:hypothetical protein